MVDLNRLPIDTPAKPKAKRKPAKKRKPARTEQSPAIDMRAYEAFAVWYGHAHGALEHLIRDCAAIMDELDRRGSPLASVLNYCAYEELRSALQEASTCLYNGAPRVIVNDMPDPLEGVGPLHKSA